MRTSYDIAAEIYAAGTTRRSSTGLKQYTPHSADLLRFFHLHRTALANHVHRAFRSYFKTSRDARRHLDTLVDAGHVHKDFNDLYQHNVYSITESGFQRCLAIEGIDPHTVPVRFDLPTGTHALHELLITETAVSLYEYTRSCGDLAMTWGERFGFHIEPAFEHLVPDWSFLQRDRHGLIWNAVEIISGEESSIRIREMFRDYATWYETPEAQEFLRRTYTHAGATVGERVPFRLLCIIQSRNIKRGDDGKERMTLMQTFFVPAEIQSAVWTTSDSRLRTAMETGTFNEPIWYRGRGLVPHRKKWGDTPSRSRKRFVDALMSGTTKEDELLMPTYPLFS